MQILKESRHLLVVDDDTRIRNLLQKYLIENGYFVSVVKDAQEAEQLLKEIQCNLIILDLMMPGENGVDFTKKLRRDKNNIPIIMLTAMSESNHRVTGLEVGADDYLVKPFEPKELLLRISNLLKRNNNKEEIYNFDDFSYNLTLNSLMKKNEVIFLTNSEHSLLGHLIKNANKIMSRENLAAELNINERSVDVQIVRLRSKIENNPSRPIFLQTIRSKGYTLTGVKKN